MRADNSHHLHDAARRRHELTRSKAIAALREIENQGTAVTFESVSAAASVSRSWLYTQPDLRAGIIALRDGGGPGRTQRDSASDNSLRTRLQAAHDRIRELTAENESLHRQLALALGRARKT
ncbi:DUF6262 family protein [Rhodococcus olei]|uniref:DUF6262 family protein n=1 Tax=Rhodococcus olei TaxID=2161675 RepID=A0ABP8NYR8_9NOCA